MAFVAPSLFKLRAVHICVAIPTFTLSVVLQLRAIRMTSETGFILMFTFKSKSGARVIKVSLMPGDRRVAVTAGVSPKSITVGIFRDVACPTRGVDGFVFTFRVTISTGRFLVLTFKGKSTHLIMVK